MEKTKIGILHPKLGRGGSEVRALWIIDALKNEYEVSLITSGTVDFQQINEYYGLNLNSQEFSVIQVPLPFFLQNTSKFAALRGRLIQRYCQKIAQNFDLLISTYNPCNFGKRAIQFIADFSFDEELREKLKWYHKKNFFRKIYLKFCNLISPINYRKFKSDIVVANSYWTAKLMKEKYGIETRVIYPPVIGDFPNIPYEEREQGFVCIGRVVPEKRIDKIIKILKKIRQRGNDVHLHIIGGVGKDSYGQFLRKLFQKHQKWIFYEGWLGKEKKKEVIARHRFGISACKNEAFGIAVAEMVKGGCIVFVPNGGGQVEIIDQPQLIYENIKDAVSKIERILCSPALQVRIRNHLITQGQKFSLENFQRSVRNIVSEFFKQKHG